jgi:hypothetical protein
MCALNFPSKLISLTKATLTIVMWCVKIQNDCSESFETRQGLRQGDVLSTLLFNVVLQVIVRRANLQTTGTIYNKETQLLAYADDIDIFGRSQSVSRSECLLSIGKRSSQSRVKINEQKTKYMIVARNDKTIHDEGKAWQLPTNTLKSSTNDVSLEIQREIQTAIRCFFGLRKHLQSSHLPRQTKFTIHKTLIPSVLLYGYETWVLTKREQNQLLIVERKVLRTICGP